MTSVLIVAGEPSGDMHAARLVGEMKRLRRDLAFFGVGGDLMAAQGVELLAHNREIAFMGFIEVIGRIPHMNRLMKALAREVENRNAPLAVLVDYPGFNLRLAGKLKSAQVAHPKVFYYISPQVWAWGAGRIHKVARLVDRMVGIIPFEAETYRGSGFDFHFVGHPLLEQMDDIVPQAEFFARHGFDPKKPLIALLPGSRPQEVARMLHPMIQAAAIISREMECSFAVAASEAIDPQQYRTPEKVKTLWRETHNLQKHSDLVIVSSGTATLETAVAGTPMIVVYITNPLNYLIAKRLVKLQRIALVNLVAGESVVPELVQGAAAPKKIADQALQILKNPSLQESQRRKLEEIRRKLGTPGASKRAAELAIELLPW